MEITVDARTLNSTQSILDFKWPYRSPLAVDQRVYRKPKDFYTWDTVYKYIPVNDSTFSDTILTGSSFEYRFEKDTGVDGSTILGYSYSGHRFPAITARGKILLIIDSTHRVFLDTSIRTFRNDLTGDGWKTEVKWFSPSTTVGQIKTYIDNAYTADPLNVKSVVLIGDLAVPYSGDFKASGEVPPDGHTTGAPPSHEGAWPSDCYYGDINSSSWTDASVTNNLGARAANRNNPADGKFDQTTLPNLVTLQVGRIDLSGMSTFSKTERELLKQYFQKNHNFRHKIVNIRERCLIDDNFGIINYPYPFYDETFGNNAYRNMSVLFNSNSTFARDYLSNLDTADYMWSFGFGNGGYTSCTGVGNTAGFAARSVKSVFTGLFGSYFGDWDNNDNLLRAPLACSGNVLNSFWVGRPHWFFHHMGLGETIGYSTMRTQNNFDTVASYPLYPTIAASNFLVHLSLMGDPSVRLQPVEPASGLKIVQDSCSSRFRLSWNAPSDTAVHSYYIFRANHIDSNFTLLGISANMTYTDNAPLSGNNVYMLRDAKLQFSGSGTYFNLGQGIFDTINTSDYFLPVANAGRDTAVCRNTYVRIGSKSNNNSSTVYNWNPASFARDTTTILATGAGNRILFATDTITKCAVKDTMVLSILNTPVNETLTVNPLNSCGDTATWSSTQNNGAGYNYLWTFAHGNPDTTSGHAMFNPGTIAYDTAGNFLTRLTVNDTLTLCVNTNTLSYTVNCLQSLPIADINFHCNLIGQNNLIYFKNNSISGYTKYLIEGLNSESTWANIQILDGYILNDVTLNLGNTVYRNIRLTGVKSDGKGTIRYLQ